MLKVLGILIAPEEKRKFKRGRKDPYAKKSRLTLKTKSYIEFALQGNAHSKVTRELALSRTCAESRDVFLEDNPYTLRARREGLIRFAREDIIYIGKIFLSFATLCYLNITN
jgi:hypothetical protein